MSHFSVPSKMISKESKLVKGAPVSCPCHRYLGSSWDSGLWSKSRSQEQEQGVWTFSSGFVVLKLGLGTLESQRPARSKLFTSQGPKMLLPLFLCCHPRLENKPQAHAVSRGPCSCGPTQCPAWLALWMKPTILGCS